MKFHGITLEQGSKVDNLTVASGTAFPASPDEGELFFRSDVDLRFKGLYLYVGGSWDRIASTDSLTAPNGETLPLTANEGDIFYLNSEDSNEGLYIYKNTSWINLSAGAAPTYTITGDVTGTIDGGTDELTLNTTGVAAGIYKSVTVDTKGRVTAGTNPTTLAGFGITDAQPLDADLTGVANVDTTGVLVRTSPGIFTTREIAVSGEGLSVSNADGVSGNPTVTSNGTSLDTPNTLVVRDGSGNFAAGTITADVVGSLTGAASANVLKSGDTMASGADLTFTGGGTVTGLPTPVDNSDAVSKQYLEQQIAASSPAGQLGQVPFIAVDGTRETELGYTVVKGQFVESDDELTEAYTRITTNETIFNEYERFSHAATAGGTLTRTSGVSRFQVSSANLATVSASFPVGKMVSISSSDTSFSGTFTITSVSSSGSNHVFFYDQIGEPDVSTPVAGSILLDDEQPAYSAEVTAWAYDGVNDVITSTVNSDSYIGFISQQRYANYEHEVLLKSTSGDDDTIGVILAWTVDSNGRQHTLSAIRSPGGNGHTWIVVYNRSRSDSQVIEDKTSTIKWGNGAYGATAVAAGYTSNPTTGGWDDFPDGTRVRAVRTGDTIVVDTTDLGESTYVPASAITIDLTSDPILEKFRGPKAIGYSALSQASASFEVLNFSDNVNTIYDVRNGNVYEYDGSSWNLVGSTNLIAELGYGRLLSNPYTNKLFFTSFEDDAAIKLVESGADRVMRAGDTMTGGLIISLNSADPGLRITQTGSGDALVVEDSANPDSTPFAVKNDGKVFVGGTTNLVTSTSVSSILQLNTNSANIGAAFGQYGADPTGSALYFLKSRGATPGSQAVVSSSDGLGSIVFEGSDGTDFARAAIISGLVDGAVAADSVPGRLIFSTTAVSGTTPTERFRITSTGAWGLSGANYGTAGQVLTSAGSGAAPTWTTATSGTVTSIDVATAGVGISSAGGPITSSGTITITSNATAANTASTIMARDSGGGFSAATAALTGLTVTNGLPVFSHTTASQVEWREGDQTLPAGRWRLTLDADTFGLRHNTAVAGDFTTYATAWQANQNNSVSFPAGLTATSTTTGTVRIIGGLGVAGDVYANSLNGSGTGLTALNASQLTSGTVPDARVAQSSVTQHQAALTIAESQITDGSLLARNAGNETITGTWTFNNPVSVGTPTANGHAATKLYVDTAVQGLQAKPAVRVATTANLTATYNNGTAGVGATLTFAGALPTIDGETLVVGNGVLVKNQTNAAHNGRYNVTQLNPGILTRCGLCDEASEIPGAYVFVTDGTQANTGWVQSVANPVTFTVGTDAISVIQFSGAGSYLGGAGLTLSGNTFDIGTASTARIVVNADNIDLATVGTAGTYNRVTTDSYGRVTSGTNNVTGTGTTFVLNTGPTINNATLTTTATFQDGSIFTSWTSSNTDIDGLTNGSTSGTLIESVANAHFTVGIRSNDLNDGFQIISKGAAANAATDPYTTLAFEVKANGNTTIGGTLNIAGATTMQAPLTINSVDNQLSLVRTANQFLVIENNNVSVNPTLTSYSAADNAKRITYRATTDDTNTTATNGDVGHNFVVYGTTRLLIDENGLTWSGTATGGGSGITALNASNITTGTVADARLSSNVALRNNNNNFSTFQNISVAASTANQEYLRLTPTNWSTGNPYLAIKTNSAAASWQMLLWDGTSNAGTIGIATTNVNLGNGNGTVAVSGALTASTNITASGAVVAGGQFLAPGSDTTSAPGYSWSGDNNTGMWRPGADTIALTNGGTQSVRIDSSRRVHVGTILPEYGKMEVLVGNYVSNLATDGYWLRATTGTGGAGWLAGLTLESDSGGTPSTALYTPNAVTAGANTAQKGLEFVSGSTGQAFRLYTGGQIERLRIEANGAWGLGGASYGTAGQVLTSNGSSTPPTWQNITISSGAFADGSVSAPSITFASDTNTGIYRVSSDVLGFTTGGTQAMTLDASGNTNVIGRLGVLSASPNNNVVINSAGTYSANATRYGIQNLVTIDNTTAITADRTHYGAFNRIEGQLQNAAAFNLALEGARNLAQTSSSGGSSIAGEGTLIGATNYALHQSGDATFNKIENMYGSQNLVQLSGATADVNNAYGTLTFVNLSTAGSSVSTAYGVRSRVITTGSSSVGTSFLYYGDISAGGTMTNRYGLYIASAINNYVSGGFQVGGTAVTGTGTSGFSVGTTPSGTVGSIRLTSWVDSGAGYAGGYNTLNGNGTNWAANIWGMGPSFIGTGSGSTFASTSHYGLAWVRGGHAQTNASIGEGLYVYDNGVLEGGIGDTGIYSNGSLVVENNGTFNSNVNITSGNLNFTSGGDQRIVLSGTVDGSDTGRIIIQASGGLTTSRTAYIIVSGNESSSPGQLTLSSGDTGGVQIGGGNVGTTISGPGGLTVSAGQILVPSGDTASAPGYSWSGDTNLGLFRAGTDVLGISTAGSERLRVDASGDVLIGSGTSVNHGGTVSRLQVQGVTNSSSSVTIARYNADTSGALLYLGKGRTSTIGQATTGLVSGDDIGTIIFTGADSSAFEPGAFIRAEATQNWTTAARGTRIVFATAANNSTAVTTALTLDQNNTATFAGAVTAASFSGSGASLTSLNASNLSSGTVPDARISGAYSGITNLSMSGTLTVRPTTATHGYATIVPGTAAQSGYLAFFAHTSGTRQGYIGYVSTNAAADAGTIPYVAGTHQFNGAITANSTITATGAINASSYSGSGAALTSLNASNLASGTVPDARISGAYSGITTLTANAIRLTSTTDASLASTGHAFQVGPDAGANIIMDGNEIMARNNGAASQLFINLDGGNISLGTSTSVVELDGVLEIANGTSSAPAIRFASDTNCGIYRHTTDTVGVNTNLYVQNEITAFSDRRVKTNVESVPDALLKLEAIRGVTYERSDLDDGVRHAGVIAQEVEEVLPEVVRTGDDGMKSVNYDGLSALLIEAIKELSEKVKVLEAKLAKYE